MALYLSSRNKTEVKTLAFLYRWTHIPTGKWYVGSRTARGCHPNDGYICSSKIVKEMITASPAEWKREILVFGEQYYILNLECSYLSALNAKYDSMSFNQHNGDGKWTTLGTTWSQEQRKKAEKSLSKSRIGRKKSANHKLAISNSLTGKIRTKEHGQAIGLARSPGTYSCDDINVFKSTRAAAKFAGVSQPTLIKWVKNNINGWQFTPKEKLQ